MAKQAKPKQATDDGVLAATAEWVESLGVPRYAAKCAGHDVVNYRVGRMRFMVLFLMSGRPWYGLYLGRECVSGRPTRADVKGVLQLAAANPDPDPVVRVMSDAIAAGCSISTNLGR